MHRVAIIGSPGTGKSTFARQLAAETALPIIHLDYYYHDKQHDYYTNKDDWQTRVHEFARAESWIIDGNFSRTLADRFRRADTIFYFDMPTYLALKGVVKRWISGRSTKRLDMPDDWEEKPTWEFFWYVLWFRHKYVAGTRELLDKNKGKTIIVFTSHKQVAAYLNQTVPLRPRRSLS